MRTMRFLSAPERRRDDPLLTDRSGLPRRRPLVRVVFDDKVRLSPESQLADDHLEAPVIVFGERVAGSENRTARRKVSKSVNSDP